MPSLAHRLRYEDAPSGLPYLDGKSVQQFSSFGNSRIVRFAQSDYRHAANVVVAGKIVNAIFDHSALPPFYRRECVVVPLGHRRLTLRSQSVMTLEIPHSNYVKSQHMPQKLKVPIGSLDPKWAIRARIHMRHEIGIFWSFSFPQKYRHHADCVIRRKRCWRKCPKK